MTLERNEWSAPDGWMQRTGQCLATNAVVMSVVLHIVQPFSGISHGLLRQCCVYQCGLLPGVEFSVTAGGRGGWRTPRIAQ